ncbi:probable peptidyl-tRNA hydrolase 2 [Euwallacea fornicatus]|uniref:probable peptidyl-tRNA hydrolase 2 n=1 Tax=Euwallacea fornicatus TaxID=995702 RepID=UPI00338EE0AF
MEISYSDFEPNSEALNILLSMGISEKIAKGALYCTGNTSPDAAIDYIFSSSSSSSLDTSKESNSLLKKDQTESQTKSPEKVVSQDDEDEWEDEDVAYYKMTFVVNHSLKMGVGKIAAQVGHACLGLYRESLENGLAADLCQWEEEGEKKIVLKGSSTEHLIELQEKAKEAKIPAYLVRDAGHTQIARGSVTVLSLFGLEEDVDKITGKLSLL